jgi:hypothetical protein
LKGLVVWSVGAEEVVNGLVFLELRKSSMEMILVFKRTASDRGLDFDSIQVSAVTCCAFFSGQN